MMRTGVADRGYAGVVVQPFSATDPRPYERFGTASGFAC
jgi:hypothetical protein